MFFRFTTAGESHGKALVTIIEGLPAGVPVDIAAIDRELWRRQQGYGRGGRMKIEKDEVRVLSGIRHGNTLGSPIALLIENRDFVHWQDIMAPEPVEQIVANSADDGDTLRGKRRVTRPRPGHADLAGGQKFQARDLRNVLERASARETAARVAAGAVAKQLLKHFDVEIKSHVAQLGGVPDVPLAATWNEISAIPIDSPLNCSNAGIQDQMIAAVDEAKDAGDTLGGVFEVVAKNVTSGVGSHTSWPEKLDGRIAQAIMSIHAVKAVEIGSGVENAAKPGSAVHDEIFHDGSSFVRNSNRAGGLEGGITNGEELRVRGYLKPISTLKKPLRSVDIDTKREDTAAYERSDVTVVPAAGVIGESMLAVVLANSYREKFGGDSLDEMRRNFRGYIDSLSSY
jgi:chorismate synthase